MTAFALTGPLPTTTLLLEASAGTGKTYTIAALAVRYIAEEGMDVGSLLMITFGNNAAAELRGRVFRAIEHAVALLDRWLVDGEAPDPEAEPVAHLLSRSADAAGCRARLAAALDRFDEATILTTHAFCQLALAGLGILGDADHAEQLSQAETLVDECAADCYLALFSDEPRPPLLPRDAQRIARKACDTTLPIEPAGTAQATYAEAVREEFDRRKHERGILTFNDLIVRMRDVLDDDVTGPAARAWLRERYTVVLVDEFQDTDPDQWQVIKSAFVADDRPTILIGDPKQSIYGFRNADILSYLDAARHSQKATLATNHRSDAGVVDGVTSLMGGMDLGHEHIQVAPVGTRHGARLDLGIPDPRRIWVRRVGEDDAATDEVMLDDLAYQVENLLKYSTIAGRPITPGDITVLARTAQTARRVTARLTGLGYPAVQFGGTNVWGQPAALDWKRLLRALAPGADAAKRVVALTDLIGASVDDLTSTSASTRIWDVLARAGRALAASGPGAALGVVRAETRLDARLTPTPAGERYLTDLLHVGELLDRSGQRDPLALLRIVEDRQSVEDEADVRVTTDEPAVKVMTLHAAKGLEFPIVLMPDMSTTRVMLKWPFNIVRDGRRHLWVTPVDERDEIGRLATAQARDEELRLLYVGLTRAKHLAVVWHIDTPQARTGPLSATLFRDRLLQDIEDSYRWQYAPNLPGVRIGDVAGSRIVEAYTPDIIRPVIRPLTFTRDVDQVWRRTSYTGLTTGLHDLPSGADEPTEQEGTDIDAAAGSNVDERLAGPAPMGALPAGAAFGTLVHEILERLDWAPAGLRSRIDSLTSELAVGFDPSQREELAAGLEAVVTAPLAPLTSQSLSGIPLQHRLPELDFDLPMAERSGATLGALADLMDAHLPAGDPLASYPSRLRSSPASGALLQGMLTGSIDAVLLTDEGRYVVVDYKTNRLAPADEPLTLGHFTQDAMAEAMMAAHYPLQAILYAAALHRYLTLRLPGYDPEQHLGGAGYLFVRGMAGPDTPVVGGHTCGVFSWFPSPALIRAVSDLLGGNHA